MDSLVTTEWLAEHLGEPDLVVLDSSWHMPASGRSGHDEYLAAHIPGARLVPLDRIPAEIPRLDKRRETILYCRVGARSMYAAQQLAEAGVADVRNLAGGILRWIDEVDPSLTRY